MTKWRKAYGGFFLIFVLVISAVLWSSWFISQKKKLASEENLAYERLMREVDITHLYLTRNVERKLMYLMALGYRQEAQLDRETLDLSPGGRPSVVLYHALFDDKPSDQHVWAYLRIRKNGWIDLSPINGVELQGKVLSELRAMLPQIIKEVDEDAVRGLWSFLEEELDHKSSSIIAQFGCYTLPLAGAERLVLLQRITVPTGRFIQGVILASNFVEKEIKHDVFQTSFLPHKVESVGRKSMSVAGTDWFLVLDYQNSLALLKKQASLSLRQFHHTATMMAAAVVLVGLLVIGLIWQAERVARQRAFFVMTAAHQLKTPLASIQLYGEMLTGGLGHPERIEKYAGHMAIEAKRLGKLVSDMLNFTMLGRGHFPIHPKIGNLGEVILQSVERYREVLKAKGSVVMLQVEEGLPHVSFDADAVNHIVQNLLDNAEKYSRSASVRTIEVVLKKNHHFIQLYVRDYGKGFQDKMNQLIKPFARGRGKHPAGLGLGLTLVEALVKAHGGSLHGENARTGGAMVIVSFPITDHFPAS